jgi:hypothetical protein
LEARCSFTSAHWSSVSSSSGGGVSGKVHPVSRSRRPLLLCCSESLVGLHPEPSVCADMRLCVCSLWVEEKWQLLYFRVQPMQPCSGLVSHLKKCCDHIGSKGPYDSSPDMAIYVVAVPWRVTGWMV